VSNALLVTALGAGCASPAGNWQDDLAAYGLEVAAVDLIARGRAELGVK
jgi:hypothetical protein